MDIDSGQSTAILLEDDGADYPVGQPVTTSGESSDPPHGRSSVLHRGWRLVKVVCYYLVVQPTRLASLIVLLAIASVIPILQLAVLGYLLEVSGRIARGGRVRDSLILLQQAGRIGMALGAVLLISLPIRMVSYWAYTADLIAPGALANLRPLARAGFTQSDVLRWSGVGLVTMGFVYLSWAWIRGGRLRHYLWPQPIRFIKTAWRPSTWSGASDRLWELLSSLQIPRLWWLGARGAIGALVWIAFPALLLIGATRNGETGLAGLVGVIGLFLMGIVVIYLPLLQVQFAADNRLRSMFAIRRVRSAFRKAPIACWTGTAATLLLAIPLYLLKIEATPKEVVWAPAILFIAFMLPGHLIAGWAMRRADASELGKRWWHTLARVLFRLLTLPVAFTYIVFVYVSQLTSWDGLATWFQQHAFLIPVPFVGV